MEHTAPLVEFYREKGKLLEIDGTGEQDEVFDRIDAGVSEVMS